MSSTPLSFEGVGFAYESKAVLDGFTLSLHPGEVTVVASPNGRGKTTALWLAAGLLRPDRGEVRVFGADPFRQREVLGRVGFLAEGVPLPEKWTGAQILAFQRETFPKWSAAIADELVGALGLDLGARVSAMSRGERGKLALTATLATEPELLLLDEPTLGLDVAARRMITKAVLGRMAEAGCAVLLASHDIADAERIGDRLVVIQDGRVAVDEPIPELLERHRVLSWDGPGEPDPRWGAVALPSPLGRRALATRWGEEASAAWRRAGGMEAPADLETIYLGLTGEVRHAW